MNNRFRFLLDEEQPKRERPTKRIKTRERQHISVRNFETKKKEIHIIEDDEVNFPSLVGHKTAENENKIEVSYGSILKNEEKSQNKKTNENKLKKGWVELGANFNAELEPKVKMQTKEEQLNEYLHFVDCMVALYECQKSEKIEILGEENYERIYKFPNYDYEYFDKLDEKYEAELEAEMAKCYNDIQGYNSDNSM